MGQISHRINSQKGMNETVHHNPHIDEYIILNLIKINTCSTYTYTCALICYSPGDILSGEIWAKVRCYACQRLYRLSSPIRAVSIGFIAGSAQRSKYLLQWSQIYEYAAAHWSVFTQNGAPRAQALTSHTQIPVQSENRQSHLVHHDLVRRTLLLLETIVNNYSSIVS